MKRYVVWLAALFLLSACALPRQVSSPEKLANIKSVIVISGVDETFGLGYVGLTVFNNTSETVPVDWKFNETTLKLLKAQLETRYTIVPFAYDFRQFQGSATSNDVSLGTATEVTARLKQVAKPGMADAFVVLTGRSGGYLSSNRRTYGMQVGLGYTINVFDGTTLEPIAQSFSGVPCERTLCLNGYDYPARKVELPWRGEPYSSLSADTVTNIRLIVFDLLERSIPNTLQRLRLVPAPAQS
jgi:hypothetical protein